MECIRGKKFIFHIDNNSGDDLLPFSREEIQERKVNSIPLYLTERIIKKLKKGEDLDARETQLLMGMLNYNLKRKEIKQIPLLEDYVDPAMEDMIFEGVEYDE